MTDERISTAEHQLKAAVRDCVAVQRSMDEMLRQQSSTKWETVRGSATMAIFSVLTAVMPCITAATKNDLFWLLIAGLWLGLGTLHTTRVVRGLRAYAKLDDRIAAGNARSVEFQAKVLQATAQLEQVQREAADVAPEAVLPTAN